MGFSLCVFFFNELIDMPLIDCMNKSYFYLHCVVLTIHVENLAN